MSEVEMRTRRLPAELADVVRRAARHPHGLGFLHRAWIDSVSVTLGVHPFAIEAVRAWLDTPEGRAELVEAVRQEEHHAPARPPSHAPSRRVLREGERRARSLVEAARRDPRGLAFLAEGPAAEVAAAFHVHPYLVFRARGFLERGARCREPEPAGVGD